MLLKNRMVFITGEIDFIHVDTTVLDLTYLSFKSKDSIKVVINSVGGSVYAGLYVYNTIRDIVNQGIEVEVEARGEAASMGAIIVQAGSKRTASAVTRFLIHECSSITWGKTTEAEEKIEELRKVNNELRDILVRRTGHTKKEIDKLWAKKEVWFSAKEALEFGLIDEILEG